MANMNIPSALNYGSRDTLALMMRVEKALACLGSKVLSLATVETQVSCAPNHNKRGRNYQKAKRGSRKTFMAWA